jgi:predicted DNA-binding transcriptional regulator AlpA
MLINSSSLCASLNVLTGRSTEADAVTRPTICNFQTLLKIIGISRSMVYLKLDPKSPYHDPSFPQPFHLAGRRNHWLISEVHDYIAKMASTRKNGGAA